MALRQLARYSTLAGRRHLTQTPSQLRTCLGSLSNANYHFIPCGAWNNQVSTHFFSTALIDDDDDDEDVEEETVRRRFEELDIHPKSLKALRRNGLHNLSEIQDKTYDVIVGGKDVVGRARTGTGKTLSFILPSLERVVRQAEASSRPLEGIQILILSPTRELAAQISKEAERMVASHNEMITSQVVYGGSSKREDIERFNRKLPTILVATPGRLKDHLASTQLDGKRPFIDALQNLQVLVLDETDRLLDMGFRRDITDILSCLPRRKRQTLLFSATLPSNVKEVIELATKPDYEMIDCIQEEDPATHTNAQTEQSRIVLPTDRFWTGSMEYLLDLVDKGDNKVMVFFPMTSMVELYATMFNSRFGRRVWELHGRMHQRERTTISRRFRNASKGVLFTSDVSARGVDYPNVTHVIQIGASESRETYIHRLGRTGRAGKKGQGLLILPEVEQTFLNELDGLDIHVDKELQSKLVGSGPSKRFMNELGPLSQSIRSGSDPKMEKAVHDAYQAMISYYFQRCDRDQARGVVATVNRLIQDMGMRELPAIELQRARRIGLADVPGLNIQSNWSDKSWTGSWCEEEGSNSPPRFGKPYGDFDGKFGGDDNSRGRSQGRGPRGPRREFGGRQPDRRREENNGNRKSNRGNSNWNSRPRDSQRGTDFNEAFTKLGWERNNKPSRSKSGKKGAFTRWEAPGEFNFRT
eukprot:Nitzschia sp. Nitz4//scaffold38_size140716//3290//5386//NITZ4_003124-RA/size140716-processed-gene-0.24-mRNA-1//1//CDS//3329550009//6437//frame0